MPRHGCDEKVVELQNELGTRKRARKSKLLAPREVISWRRAVDQPDVEMLSQGKAPRPAVILWRNAVLGNNGPRSPITRAVLLVLAHHMDQYGQAWPSFKTISRESMYSRRAVVNHMLLAQAEYWLEVTTAQGYASGWRRNEYIACIPTFSGGA